MKFRLLFVATALLLSMAAAALAQSAGNWPTTALTTQRTYDCWLLPASCFWALSSANALAPSWFSSAWDTAPTYWVRPVGEVVVAQAETPRAMAADNRRGYRGRMGASFPEGCGGGRQCSPSHVGTT